MSVAPIIKRHLCHYWRQPGIHGGVVNATQEELQEPLAPAVFRSFRGF